MLTSTKYKSVQRQIKNNKYRNLIQYWKTKQSKKKIMAKDNIELKAQNQTLQKKMQENHEKYDKDLKMLHKAKEDLQNQNKEQISKLKDYLQKKINALRPY